MRKNWRVLLFLFYLLFSKMNVFSGLLPDNMVLTGPNQYCKVKNLDIGDRLVALGSTKYNLRDRYSNIAGIKINGSCTDKAILKKILFFWDATTHYFTL